MTRQVAVAAGRTEPYTVAERADLRRHTSSDVQHIANAQTASDADFRAALALETAATYLELGAADEALELVGRASEVWNHRWTLT